MQMIGRPSQHIAYLLLVSLFAFSLNWLWEMVQMPAYLEMADRGWFETAARCTQAAFGDVACTLGIYALGALTSGRLTWGMASRWNAYLAAGIMGAGVAIGIEWRALALGSWSYNERMPVVPLVDVGLGPLLQLAVLAPLAFRFGGQASKWLQR